MDPCVAGLSQLCEVLVGADTDTVLELVPLLRSLSGASAEIRTMASEACWHVFLGREPLRPQLLEAGWCRAGTDELGEATLKKGWALVPEVFKACGEPGKRREVIGYVTNLLQGGSLVQCARLGHWVDLIATIVLATVELNIYFDLVTVRDMEATEQQGKLAVIDLVELVIQELQRTEEELESTVSSEQLLQLLDVCHKAVKVAFDFVKQFDDEPGRRAALTPHLGMAARIIGAWMVVEPSKFEGDFLQALPHLVRHLPSHMLGSLLPALDNYHSHAWADTPGLLTKMLELVTAASSEDAAALQRSGAVARILVPAVLDPAVYLPEVDVGDPQGDDGMPGLEVPQVAISAASPGSVTGPPMCDCGNHPALPRLCKWARNVWLVAHPLPPDELKDSLATLAAVLLVSVPHEVVTACTPDGLTPLWTYLVERFTGLRSGSERYGPERSSEDEGWMRVAHVLALRVERHKAVEDAVIGALRKMKNAISTVPVLSEQVAGELDDRVVEALRYWRVFIVGKFPQTLD